TDEIVAAKTAGSGARPPDADAERLFDASAAPGAPLPLQERERFEQGLGVDLGTVRVHVDADAARITRSLDALAVTRGPDIYFSPGAYAPRSSEGARLLAPELVP